MCCAAESNKRAEGLAEEIGADLYAPERPETSRPRVATRQHPASGAKLNEQQKPSAAPGGIRKSPRPRQSRPANPGGSTNGRLEIN